MEFWIIRDSKKLPSYRHKLLFMLIFELGGRGYIHFVKSKYCEVLGIIIRSTMRSVVTPESLSIVQMEIANSEWTLDAKQ